MRTPTPTSCVASTGANRESRTPSSSSRAELRPRQAPPAMAGHRLVGGGRAGVVQYRTAGLVPLGHEEPPLGCWVLRRALRRNGGLHPGRHANGHDRAPRPRPAHRSSSARRTSRAHRRSQRRPRRLLAAPLQHPHHAHLHGGARTAPDLYPDRALPMNRDAASLTGLSGS